MRIPELIAQRSPFISLEFFPPKKQEEWSAFLETAQELKALNPLYCSVTYGAGGSTQDNTLEICQQLIDTCGFTVMPHLTSVTASEAKINDFLDAISRMGIDNVLALRGDRPAGYTGPDSELYAAFPHASDLIRHIRSHSPHLAIGAAAFPEAHAESPSFTADIAVMREKFDCGAHFAITQLYFDNRCYFDYVDRLRQLGVSAPIIPGILPVRSLASLRFTLKLCNARVPGELINAVLEAEEKKGPEAVYEVGIAYARRQVQELLDGGVPGIHLYTLNRADMCIRLMEGLM